MKESVIYNDNNVAASNVSNDGGSVNEKRANGVRDVKTCMVDGWRMSSVNKCEGDSEDRHSSALSLPHHHTTHIYCLCLLFGFAFPSLYHHTAPLHFFSLIFALHLTTTLTLPFHLLRCPLS